MCAGDKVEGKLGQQHRRWIESVLPRWGKIFLKEVYVNSIVERVSARLMSLKLEIKGGMLNVVSTCAPQV